MPDQLNIPSSTVFGSLLKTARTNSGYTLKQVSGQTGLAVSTISDIETGKRKVSMVELYKFSKIYQCPLDFFFEQDKSDTSFAVLYRVSDEAFIEKKMIIEFHELCRDYKGLQKVLKAPVVSSVPDHSESSSHSYEQAEELAEVERSSLGLNGQPIKDICDLFEGKRGIKIFHLPEASGNFSGAFTYDEYLGACFLINSAHPLRRRTFTVAHEYAHCIAHRNQLAHVDTGQSFTTRNPRERFANAFAAAFLMPGKAVNELLSQLSPWPRKSLGSETLLRLAVYFGVSYEAMGWRLVSLRKLSRFNCEALLKERIASSPTARLLGYKNDIETPDITPSNYKYLACTAYKKKMISFERLAELLRKNYYELKQEFSINDKAGNE
jgi:Zn-dependent peptidase ImmA (M78 family)/transcriptional regulator with XRE-family HTH domain